MRQVQIDGKTVNIHCTAFTPYIYETAFGRDLWTDLADVEANQSLTVITRMLWAEIKTVNRNIPSYDVWLDQTETLNLDPEAEDGLTLPVMEELKGAFFPSRGRANVVAR